MGAGEGLIVFDILNADELGEIFLNHKLPHKLRSQVEHTFAQMGSESLRHVA